MATFKAPLQDMLFLFNDVFDFQTHYQSFMEGRDATADVVEQIVNEVARFSEEVLFPLYQPGDAQGCRLEGGRVITPKGFREAYRMFVEGGWQGLSHPAEYGGMGLPLSLGVLKSELIATANWPWGMYPGLSLGAMNTLYLHGTEEQKQLYLRKLIEGTWTGTMCLTEPQCGTDLGQVRTRAEALEDGSYALTGTKIFISAGDHDLADNIVHIVLARLPGAPKGSKGISLFVVPKYLPGEQGEPGELNHVVTSGLEHKMGIASSSTCVLNFEGARGWLVGPPNEGLACMFTFMNTARIGTGMQGVAAAELAFQNAVRYARERQSMRALSGKKYPERPADPIIVHPDVRRMLLTQKAFVEGGRALLYYVARIADVFVHSDSAQARERADDTLGFLTPIVKAFLTETGWESVNLGLQVFGGHGYIREHGMEQIVRDTRIATLYEGTTGIQALDLLGRKLILDKGEAFRRFTAEISDYCSGQSKFVTGKQRKKIKPMIQRLAWLNRQWAYLSLRVGFSALRDRDEVGSAAYDYLMYSGYIVLAYMWLLQAESALEKLARNEGDETLLRAKVDTCRFYFDRILPRARTHHACMLSGARNLMHLPDEGFHANLE